jgi:hypothetical protein
MRTKIIGLDGTPETAKNCIYQLKGFSALFSCGIWMRPIHKDGKLGFGRDPRNRDIASTAEKAFLALISSGIWMRVI